MAVHLEYGGTGFSSASSRTSDDQPELLAMLFKIILAQTVNFIFICVIQ